VTGLAALGWLAAVSGPVANLSQLWHILRHRRTDGLSLLMWQLLLTVATGWAMHGLNTGRANIIATNLVSALGCFLVLWLTQRERHLGFWRVMAPPVALGLVVGLLDPHLPPALFGLILLAPAVAGLVFQALALIRSDDIRGVSPWNLVLNLTCQVLWTVWSLMAHDPAITWAGSCTGVAVIINLTLYGLRRGGVLRARPYRLADRADG
jgi:uncharacterized protein with PQ loop repeat